MTLLSIEQLFTLFSSLNTWQDRYRQIIQLAKTMPTYPEHARITENQIQGCENSVWLTFDKNPQDQFYFYGDSEGRIVKGLMAIILILANGKSASEIAETDFLVVLKDLKIINELSESRQSGVKNIIDKIKELVLHN